MRELILLLCLLMSPLYAFANSEEAKPDESKGPIIEYLEMKPKFTVNLAEPKKYLMVNVQLLVEGAAHVEKIKKLMPVLRNEMIMLLSGMPIASIQTSEQREALRLKTKDTLTGVLTKSKSNEGFQDVFFSEFLVN